MNKIIKKIYQNNNKITILIYLIIRLYIIINLINEIMNVNIQNILLCIFTIILLTIPFLLEKKYKIKIPQILKTTFFIYVFGTQILGEVNHFYVRVPHWDKIFHTLHGFISAGFGVSIIYLLNKKLASSNLSPKFIILVAFCISITIGVGWEVLEYGADLLFNTDMQNDRYVDEINSMYLDSQKENKVIKIKNIDYVILYDKDDNIITKFNGYIDIGIHDTMIDLIVSIIGAIIFLIIYYPNLLNNKKNKFIDNFIIKKDYQ